ncbi:MAG: grasp-with-spasm system ATP-grasp peptide maturase [Taibaiella sp.]|nr:grasp-with-spasm system ATP-grasp peptide maturase [Taibaiella sp.]
MILILSERNDNTTNKVVEWLRYYKAKYIRLNLEDRVELVGISIDRFIINLNNVIINSDDIEAYWYRRGDISIKTPDLSNIEPIYENFLHSVNQFHVQELNTMIEFIHWLLAKTKRNIGSILNASVNKMIVLNYAKEIGLNVPETYITCNSKEMVNFFGNNKKLISKPVSENFVSLDTNVIMSYTEEISLTNLDTFFHSLAQTCINKEYEIRTFFLKTKVYSMAIFSQLNDQTKTDFRKYSFTKPNRNVPYALPTALKKKVFQLMNKLKLDTGSIDMIKSTDGKYYFLEVNPIGQFGMVSSPCNYYLEREVANALTNTIAYGHKKDTTAKY